MLDRHVRGALAPALERVAGALVRAGVRPWTLTLAGLVAGAGAAVAAGLARWTPALVLFLVSRVADGLDGPVARQGGGGTELGGLLDILADFAVYGGFVAGCAVGRPDARVACAVLLLAYYLNGSAFLAFSSVAERRGLQRPFADERSLTFLRGLAEGTETTVAHSLMALLPDHLATIAWVFAGVVGVTVLQRVTVAVRLLR